MFDFHLITTRLRLPDHALIQKVAGEPVCRTCRVRRSEHRALSVGWLEAETNDPRGAVALCSHCADEHSRGELDLWRKLEPAEQVFAAERYGSFEDAREVLFPSDYSRSMEQIRRAA